MGVGSGQGREEQGILGKTKRGLAAGRGGSNSSCTVSYCPAVLSITPTGIGLMRPISHQGSYAKECKNIFL